MVGGLFWGCLCGALTNLINTNILFWGAYLFALCSIATAVITWLFTRLFRQELYLGTTLNVNESAVRSRRLTTLMDRMIALILLSFALCLAMSILGGAIAGFIQIVNPSLTEKWGISVITISMFGKNFPIVLREILSRIPINIVDRLVSVFAGFGVAVLIKMSNEKLAMRKEERTGNKEKREDQRGRG
jgi:hypothetical protein